ncbi:putative HTH-type transcriptional regulator YdfH [Phaeobacter sp. CECT 5382]|uniref:GntR family transcriptional regulator n=1 Tax=Rhodobacterales TaxID=204455 RepID=UPI0006DAFBA6|nr:GntR family transcriptional regulator [Phaeobacter sp. CECT 5382]CUH87068.1 putative HTH-type transcriptional regulator YdfH [Phaeobacter sp. CECT 5382]
MENPAFAQLKIDQPPATLREIVQEKMRDAIISGLFAPGERLVERPLCDQLGVSRTVVRETIRYLEAEGLVEILPNRGPIVAPLSWEDARQIYEIRRMLETEAAMACAQSGSKQLHRDLQSALAALKQAFAQNAADAVPGALFKASTRFYQVMFEAAGHHIAWEVVNRLNGRISRLRAMTLSAAERQQPGLFHMQAICDAIVAGDAAAARQAVETHLADASAVAERLLSTEEQE